MSGDAHLATRRFLASLTRRDLPAVFHLLACEDCTLNALESLGREMGEYPSSPTEAAVDYTGAFQGLEAAQPGILEALQERRREASSLLESLLDVPAEERLRAVARDRRFHQPHLAELLLERSQRAQPKVPRRAEELARLAYAVAERGAAKAEVDYTVSLKARACCLQGSALRLQRRFVDADHAFDQAAYVLAGPLDLPERAEFLEKLGLLKADLGRVDEALALLWRAGYLWGQEADLHRQGVCLAWVGLLYLDHEDMERALPALVQARIAIAESAEPALACRVRLGLALCHAAQGRGATAERFVKEARQLYARVKDETRLIRFRWVEGKIAAQAGELAQALELLLAVRRGLMREGQLHEAALATLDLALVLARLERWEEIHPLVHELVEAFPNDPATNGAVIALGAFEALARGREDLRRARALAAGYLRRMRRRGLALEEA